MMKNSLIAMHLCAILAAPAPTSSDEPDRAIYGTDSRVDHSEITDPKWRAIGDATVIQIGNPYPGHPCPDAEQVFSPAVDGVRTVTWTTTLEQSLGANCGGTLNFAEQLNPGCCSGTLIAPNKIATAGHCVNADNCASKTYVFGATSDKLVTGGEFHVDQIYKCQKVDISVLNGLPQDYAVITLDRVVPESVAKPVTLSDQEPSVGDSLIMIGHPAGLPRKYADDATVKSVWNSGTESAYYMTNLDAFGGNSGSGVFNTATYEMMGILVSGATDFYAGGCEAYYPQEAGSERLSNAITLLPFAGPLSPPTPPPFPPPFPPHKVLKYDAQRDDPQRDDPKRHHGK